MFMLPDPMMCTVSATGVKKGNSQAHFALSGQQSRLNINGRKNCMQGIEDEAEKVGQA